MAQRTLSNIRFYRESVDVIKENCEIKNFINESRRFQTLFANLEGFNSVQTVNVREKEKLFNLLLWYCNSGNGVGFLSTQILKQAVSKIISIHQKHNQSDEIGFTFSWIYYFVHNEKLTKKLGVCEILITGRKERVFLNLRNLGTYNSWDKVLESINSPGSLVCSPSNGMYIVSQKNPVIELEYFCLRETDRPSFFKLEFPDIFGTCEPYFIIIKKWWSELNLEALWRKLKEDLKEKNLWEKFLKVSVTDGSDILVLFLMLKDSESKDFIEYGSMLPKLVNLTQENFTWKALIDEFLRQPYVASKIRHVSPCAKILSNFISLTIEMLLELKKIFTKFDYKTFLSIFVRWLTTLLELKLLFSSCGNTVMPLKFLIWLLQNITLNAIEPTSKAVEITTAVARHEEVYLKIQEYLLEVLIPHLKSREVESRENLVAKSWKNFFENFLKRNEETPLTDSDGEIFKDHETGFQYHIFQKDTVEINEPVKSVRKKIHLKTN